MHAITRLSAEEFDAELGGLAALLAEAVADGASLGFRSPFGREQALAWWRTQRTAVAEGALTVWAARGPQGTAGTVALAHCPKPNGAHRAEVVKLMVAPAARGRGLGRRLLGTAERYAADAGATLLLLDTETGSAADRLYASAGWTGYGTVPDYATDPDGTLRDCTFFYKRIGGAETPRAARTGVR